MSTETSTRIDSRDDSSILFGFVFGFEALARLFLDYPDAKTLEEVALLADALNCEFSYHDESDASLHQRFDDRLFVPSSGCFVPLSESCISSAMLRGQRWTYGLSGGSCSIHVEKCYKATGFSYDDLPGCSMVKGTIAPDSLAAELAFMGFLFRLAANTLQDDQQGEMPFLQLAQQFSEEHISRWLGKAADCLKLSGEDIYSQACLIAQVLLAEAKEMIKAD